MRVGRIRLPSSPRRLSMLRMENRRRRFLILSVLVALAYLVHSHSGKAISYRTAIFANLGSYLDVSNVEPANATLGFGAIVAVSQATSPRRKGLLTAAHITGLDITIPEQPVWTDQDVENLRADPKTSILTRGSAMAWLGHLNALRWFLDSSLETVLILEDDVDWDIHLRTEQVPKVAAAARALLLEEARHPSPKPFITRSNPDDRPIRPVTNLEQDFLVSPDSAGGYWGDTGKDAAWDIMYLGHCGDVFTFNDWTNTSLIPRASFPDPTLPNRDHMHPITRSFLDGINVPPQTRLVHRSVSPLCTFGFALTRHAAKRLLDDVANNEKIKCGAYDVRILEACRDFGFRCWTSTPELFHHQDQTSLISLVDHGPPSGKTKEQKENEADYKEKLEAEHAGVRATMPGDIGRVYDEERALRLQLEREKEVAEDAAESQKRTWLVPGVDPQGRLMGAAPNIACGIRSVSMYSEDAATVEYLREVVGKQGRCLRDEMAEDMSLWPEVAIEGPPS